MDRQNDTHPLRTAREAAGLTREDLASRAGVSFRTIEQIESGRTGAPRRATKRVLATAVGREPDDIWPAAEVAA